MDDEAIQWIVRMALAQDQEERDQQSQLATQAAVAAALVNQTSQVQALCRPDLPPFDKEHIEVWIQRVEFGIHSTRQYPSRRTSTNCTRRVDERVDAYGHR